MKGNGVIAGIIWAVATVWLSSPAPLAAQGNAIVQAALTGCGPADGNPCTLAANDDDSTDAVNLNIDGANGINFFGQTFTQAYVNNNGNITFGGPFGDFTPNAFALGIQCDNSTGTNCPIIGPFFADVDTSGTGSGLVTYGNATVQDEQGNSHNAFVTNYINVGYFSGNTDKLNSFQLILLDRSDVGAGDFDIEFNYNTILWETGDASGGTDGLGGTSAAVGYSNGLTGSDNIYLQLPGSLISGALINGGPDALISHSINSTVPGRYIFPVRQGQVTLFPAGLTCTPGLLGSGGTGTCTVSMTGSAAAGGASVSLSSNNAALSVPASVSVPAGQSSATFTVTASSVSTNQSVTVTASFGGSSLSTTVTLSNVVQVGYIGVFYNSTPPTPCPAGLTTLCTANNQANNNPNVGDGGPVDGPVFTFVNSTGTDITNAVIALIGVPGQYPSDSFNIGTIPANGFKNVVPGVSDDGQNHGDNNFFTVTGTPYDTSDNFPSLNSTQFKFTGQQGSGQIVSADVCGVIGPPIFTPACTAGPSNDGTVPNINFLGGPGDNDGPCDNCFGPQIVASLGAFGASSGSGGPLSITTTTLSNGTVSTAGTQTFSASGGTGPYSWALFGGSIPPGMTLSSSGTLSGTPSKAGTYTFSVKVTDANGSTAVETVTLTISAQPVIITTPSPLPAGMISVQYPPQILSATGGFAPYAYSITNNQLPGGLTLAANGTISGTPTATGTFQFTITATDQEMQTGTATLSITVRALAPALSTSAGSLSFTLAAGATALPASQTVYVEATEASTPIPWSAINTPSVTWLTVSGGAAGSSTPGSFLVSLTPAAERLAASTTPYSTTIVVACAASSPCAGTSQNITVSLLVSTVSPQLTPLTNLLSFNTASTNAQTTTQSLGVENSGGGTLSFTSVTCGQSWCVPGPAPASLGGGASENISVQANPAGLSAGFYFTELTIVSSAGTAEVPVNLLIQSNPSLVLNPAGSQVALPAGGVAANPDTAFLVNLSGAASSSASVSWSASVLPGATWLSVNTANGSSTPSSPGSVSYSLSQSTISTLAAGVYYGTIRVTSSGVINSPEDFQVVLNVEAANAPQVPNPTPAGLVFTANASGAAPPAQTDRVYASSAAAVPYQAAATTADGASWLSVTPATGTTTAAQPAQSSISVNPTGLAAGIYHGTVSYSLAAAAVPSVNVTLIVEPAASGSGQRPSGEPTPQATSTCTPSKIVPTQTALVNDFAAPAAWPIPLQIQLSDDCGNAVVDGQVVSTFSNGDPPLILVPQDATSGLYSATWTPHSTGAQVTVTASASAPSLTSASEVISGAVVPNQVPVINPGGTVHAFTPQSGQPLAPGTWMAIYGSDLADETLINGVSVFPPTLAGTSVIIGGEESPLYFVSTGQINALIPYDLTSGQTYQVIVNNNNALSTPVSFTTTAMTPGVAAYLSGYAQAEHNADGSLITEASPAKPGEYIIIYLVGMGATNTPPVSGEPMSGLDSTTVAPSVTLNGEAVTNLPYSGLTPTAVGLYQIDLQVPADAPNGDLPLVVTQGGVTTPTVILPVHN